jgi:hypothetical protein
MAIITYPLNGVDYNAEDAETYFCTRTSGVFSSENNFALSIGEGMNVSIGPGIAWIRNEEFSGKSVVSTEDTVFTVPLTDGVLGRKDRIVIRFDKALNASGIVLKQGTPSSTPVAPEIERTSMAFELGLYIVDVPVTAVSLSMANITNTMLDENVCGLMRDGVTQIPTEALVEQATEIIEEIKRAFESAVSENIPNHSFTHYLGGDDEIRPSDIGAAAEINKIVITGPVNTEVIDNADFDFSRVTSFTLTGAEVDCHGFVRFASSGVNVTKPKGFMGSFGDDITEAKANEIWEFSCSKGFIIWKNWSAEL